MTVISSSLLGWLVAVAWALAGASLLPAAESHAVLHLAGGGHVAGELLDTDQANLIRWQGAAFTAPFEFPWDAVATIYSPPSSDRLKAEGQTCFELAGDDTLFGSLAALTGDEVVIETARFGRLHVERSAIRRWSRRAGSVEFVYSGPIGLSGWQEPAGAKGWRQEVGHVLTDSKDASLFGDVAMPAQAAIELELSWNRRPDFAIALGVGNDRKTDAHAFRIEVWDDKIVLQRETERDADVVAITSIGQVAASGGRAGRLRLQIYLDQQRGRAWVCAPKVPPCRLDVAGAKPELGTGLRLTNKRGDLRLARLRISHWDGQPPLDVQSDKAHVQRTDGSVVHGQLRAFDRETGRFVVHGEAGEVTLAAGDVQRIVLPAANRTDARSLRAVFADGGQVSGVPQRVRGGTVWLTCPGVKEPLGVRLAELHSLLVLRQAMPASAAEQPLASLELEGVQLSGRLVEGSEQPDASCLVWLPRDSRTASPLRKAPTGRIAFHSVPPPAPKPTAARSTLLQALFRNQPAPAATPSPPRPPPPPPKPERMLYLNTGDILPYDSASIDPQGVHLRSTLCEAALVPHERMQGLELRAFQRPAPVNLGKIKRERLLTLPRVQKDNPPTQLVLATNGDCLRGRILSLDDAWLSAEVRLETRRLPRDHIACILWLSADQDKTPAAPAPVPAGAGTRVRAVGNGIALTFWADHSTGTVLSGRSGVLGTCRIDPSQLEWLLFGADADAAAKLAARQWKLHPAAEPRTSPEERGQASSERPAGTESPLVGQAAPEFELELLRGNKFRLADAKGKVVVLDFWATWCVPCMQVMPQAVGVVGEIPGQDVRFVAVNLQEDAERITATLERLKLRPDVAMDRTGKVAAKYGITGIPQTVVIARDGKVARHIVGGGPHYPEQLREALRAVLAAPPRGQ